MSVQQMGGREVEPGLEIAVVGLELGRKQTRRGGPELAVVAVLPLGGCRLRRLLW